MPVLDREVCFACGQTTNSYEVSLNTAMVQALWSVVLWCVKNHAYRFSRQDIKHLLKTDVQVAGFGDWVLFGGLVSKEGKGNYFLNKEKIKGFFGGTLEIPIKVSKNPKTKKVSPLTYGYITDIPNISHFLDEDQDYIVRYRSDHGGE